MESPTTDISMGMKALRLGLTDPSISKTTREENDASIPATFSKSTPNLTSFETLRNPKEMSPHPFTLSPLQLGPVSTRNTQSNYKPTQCQLDSSHSGCTSEGECACKDQAEDCPVCQRLRLGRLVCQSTVSRTGEDIADSFNSLRVNTDSPPLVANSLPYRAISCRQQEAVYSSYSGRYNLDDTTVDELAGYFDEMMYLPKPMSEMAELMYT